MKILIPFWELGDFERYIPQFRQLGLIHEITFLYMRGTPKKPWFEWADFTKFELKPYGHKYADMFLNQRLVNSFIPLDTELVYSLSGLWFNLYGNSIADYLNVPHVIRMRGDMVEARKYQKLVSTKGTLQRIIFSRAMDEALRRATLIVPIVDKFKLTLEGLGIHESKIFESVPNGINLAQWTRNLGPDKFTPGYAGRISEEKGSEFLERLIRETPEYTWKITGPIQSESFKIPPNCHYLGVTPYEKMDDFYKDLSVLVCPSETEGFPNTLLEFYAQNKPVIVSPDFLPEEVRVFGQVVSTSELDNWIGALVELEDLYESYLEDGPRNYVVQFGWYNYADKMTEAFNKALYLHSLT
jgi:glycosyltransferase involved in cell wall biosynthesis